MHPVNRIDQKTLDENPFINLKIDDISVLDKVTERSTCKKCKKSRKYFCYICYIPVPQLEGKIPKLELPIKIDIIKHKNEIEGKSTAAHAALLAPNHVKIFTYPNVPIFDEDEYVVLVYPSVDAKTVRQHFEENAKFLEMNDFPFTRAVFIDSTWNQSKGIFKDGRICSLPTLVLKNKISQFWRHQKNSPRWYLATIEAIHQLLVELEYEKMCWQKLKNQEESNIDEFYYNGKYDNLLFFFYFMYTKIHDLYDHESLLSYKRPLNSLLLMVGGSLTNLDNLDKIKICFENKMKDSKNCEIIKFKNCYILRNHQMLFEDFWIRDGKIIDPEKIFFDEKCIANKEIDCKGAFISPGFIDIQINGGFGIDFSQSETVSKDDIEKVAKGILAHGVTAFCPTVVTSPSKVYQELLPVIKKRPGGKHGATILGVHLEGPFINPEKKGAHSPDCIRTLEKGMNSILEVYHSLNDVVLITLAPEIEGATDVIRALIQKGIVVSLGHSQANLEQAEIAFENGASLITHLFNAMLPFHHRDPGLVGLLASDVVHNGRTVYFGIIADGVHTHPTALRMAHRIHPKGLILVTDAISALGFEEGSHTIGQKKVQIKNGHAFISGTGILCGSIATMNFSIKFFKKSTGCSVVEALEAATLHPALALNISDKKGTLNFGSDADFVLLSPDLDVISTWIAGECVYQAPR